MSILKNLLPLFALLLIISCGEPAGTGTNPGNGFLAKSVMLPSGSKGEVLQNGDTMEFKTVKHDTTACTTISWTTTDTIRHTYVKPVVVPPIDTTPITQPPVTGTRQNLILENTFEGNPWAGFTLANGQFVPTVPNGTVPKYINQVTAPDGIGKCLQFILHKNDPVVSGSVRAEIQLNGTDAPETSERWYGLRYWLQQYDKDDGAESVIQWHDQDGSSPPLSLQVSGGRFNICRSVKAGNFHYDLGTTDIGKWINIVIHVKWSSTTDTKGNGVGLLEVWRDGTKLVNAVNVATNSKGGSYEKIGINKWSWGPASGGGGSSTISTDRIFYIDNYRMGNEKATYNDVVP